VFVCLATLYVYQLTVDEIINKFLLETGQTTTANTE